LPAEPELYVTYSAETCLQNLNSTSPTVPKLDCRTWTLRHLQCRNVTAEPELYVTYSAETWLQHLFSLLLASVMHVSHGQLNSYHSGDTQFKLLKSRPVSTIRSILQTHKSSLRVSQRCNWELRYSEMWRHVDWWVVSDVSKNHGVFIFRGQGVQEKGDTTFQNLGNHSPKDTASRHLNPQNFPSKDEVCKTYK
jgi:hypothetical protein